MVRSGYGFERLGGSGEISAKLEFYRWTATLRLPEPGEIAEGSVPLESTWERIGGGG